MRPIKQTPQMRLHRRKAQLVLALLVVALVGLSLASASSSSPSTSSAASNSGKAHLQQDKFKPVAAKAVASPQEQTQVAEKKQGDQQLSDLFNTDEYVQIKPEEINVNEQGKEVEPSLSLLEPLSQASSSNVASAAASSASSASQQVASGGAQQQQQPSVAEHKSAVDDELNAHLAQDTISSMESSYIPAGAHQQPRAFPQQPAYRPAGHMAPSPAGYPSSPRGYHPGASRHPVSSSYLALAGKLAGGITSLVHPQPASYPHPHPPPPPAMRRPRAPYGPPPAAGHPAHPPPPPPMAASYGPRYLPRGAAAGYAAFREFVRAQASKYKQTSGLGGPHEPAAYNAAPNHHGGRYVGPPMAGPQPHPHPSKPSAPPAHPEPTGSYGPPPPPPPAPVEHHPRPAPEPYAPAPAAPSEGAYAAPAPAPAAPKTKVSVAQAYIPHLTSAPEAGKSYPQPSSSSGYSAGPQQHQHQQSQHESMLAKLYGGHAPQGVGKPEYSKDYGMVIHYPQATVYTEPMTVDQLHKLTGSGVTQILEQLQYNIANGHRDESNTIRAHQKHHLGHGLTIHAKEYYAPGKTGHYVPTTAAVISSSSSSSSSSNNYDSPASHEAPAADGYQAPPAAQSAPAAGYEPTGGSEPAAYGMKAELGAGYERVKAAVAASTANYNNQNQKGASKGAASYGSGENVGNLLSGAELESLYKANADFTKHLEQPEVHAQIQSYAEQIHAKGPLRMTEHSHKSPLALHATGPSSQSYAGPAPRPQGYSGPPARPAHPHRQPHPHPQPPQHPSQNRYRSPRRPAGGNQHPHGPPRGPYRPQHGRGHAGRPNGYRNNNNYRQQQHHHQQQQQQQYNMAEQAVHQQMMQLLHDFQVGDEQYNSKGQPMQATNQGYPHKVLQKHHQQQQQHQQNYNQQQQYQPQPQPQQQNNYQQGQSQQGGYNNADQSDHLEIPQGPNDQIGEISELIDALKGSLESGKPDEGAPSSYASVQPEMKQVGKLEDVRYLSATLGQVPSYAAQVNPIVAAPATSEHEAKKGYGNAQPAPPAPASYPQPPSAAPQGQQYTQQQQQVQPVGSYQPPTAAAGYPQQSAGEQSYGHQQNSNYGQQAPTHESAPVYQQHQPEQSNYGQQPQQQPQQVDGYQQVAQAADYVHQVAQVAAAAAANGSPYGGAQQQQPEQSGYNQQPQQQQHHQQQSPVEAAQPYSNSEHTQVINHLVPVQQAPAQHPQQQPQQQYEALHQQQAAVLTAQVASHPHQQQPLNQITVAAPTDQQYHSAQSLSSFVDSLPSDYQELLRQPAGHLLEGAASAPDSIYSNATSSSAASSSSSAASHGDILKASASSTSSQSLAPSPIASDLHSSGQTYHQQSTSSASNKSPSAPAPASSSSSTNSASAASSGSASNAATSSSAASQSSPNSKRKAKA